MTLSARRFGTVSGMGDFLSDNPILVVIAACEVGFWVLLVLGLVSRYLLRARKLSTVLLLAVPLVDLVLVGASLADVAGGRTPGFTHGLAAAYLGFTVAFGHSTIRWMDARFAHRFAGGPAPTPPPKYGREKVAYEWRAFSRGALGWAVALAVLAATALVAGSAIPGVARWFTDPLWTWGARLTVALLVWFVCWPLWLSVFPPRRPAVEASRG